MINNDVTRDARSATLLHLLRNGGADQARTRFVTLYTPLYLFWSRRLESQDSDATDLLSEVFVSILAQMPTFK